MAKGSKQQRVSIADCLQGFDWREDLGDDTIAGKPTYGSGVSFIVPETARIPVWLTWVSDDVGFRAVQIFREQRSAVIVEAVTRFRTMAEAYDISLTQEPPFDRGEDPVRRLAGAMAVTVIPEISPALALFHGLLWGIGEELSHLIVDLPGLDRPELAATAALILLEEAMREFESLTGTRGGVRDRKVERGHFLLFEAVAGVHDAESSRRLDELNTHFSEDWAAALEEMDQDADTLKKHDRSMQRRLARAARDAKWKQTHAPLHEFVQRELYEHSYVQAVRSGEKSARNVAEIILARLEKETGQEVKFSTVYGWVRELTRRSN